MVKFYLYLHCCDKTIFVIDSPTEHMLMVP